MAASVVWISYTPVKGLGLRQLDQAEVTDRGLAGDRRFHLINEKGHLTNGKRVGALQQVTAEWDEAEQRLALHFPEGRVVEEQISVDGDATRTNFHGRPVEGALVSGPFSQALSEFTGTELKLVQPTVPGAGVDRGKGGGVTILSTGSLERLSEAAEVEEVDGRRFRMNIGVDGVDPHAEDEWVGRRVQIGEVVVEPRGHVGRCLITSRHPESGEIDLDTLNALATYRKDLETTEKLAFGVFGKVIETGTIRLGDPVVVR